MRSWFARAGTLAAVSALAGCAQVAPAPFVAPAPPPSAPADAAAPPPAMQYLYGSAEAAALSRQAFTALIDYARAQVAARPVDSVVLAAGSDLADRRFVPCGDKPFAAVFDVDETLLLNLGFEYHDARHHGPYDPAAWARYEQTGAASVAPVPGALAMVSALRGMGVTVIFNTNRAAANAAGTVEALRLAGFGDAVHGQTLFLKGDDADGSGKDGRRATIAARYCVIAMGGDQLGDFSDLFMAQRAVRPRRALADDAAAPMWGRGWFVLPNPVYGAGLHGGFDDVFPADKRWVDPAEEK